MDAKTGKRIHPVFVYMMSKVQSCSCTKICICIWQMYITGLLSGMVDKLSRSSLLNYYDIAGVRNKSA